MKKKIIAICLCVALVAVGIVGATLAYFTDKDQVNNTFAIGNVSIDLWENGSILDPEGNVVQEVVEQEQKGIKYEGLMPSYKIQKQPYITNVGKSEAYVRVAVVMNNYLAIDKAIDQAYEAKGYTADEIQDVYDNVFEGWGVNYAKRETNGRRMWMDDRGEPVLFNVDMIGKLEDSYAMVDMNNHFQTAEEAAKWADPSKRDGILNVTQGDPYGYYWDAAKPGERVYVFYLKLDANQGYKLFEGLNVPADFTGDQLKMFDGLKIDIYADAIQTAGFATAEEAFNALEAEHALGWWN